MSTPTVVAGVSKTYGSGPERVVALEHVDLEAAPGESIAIIGPTGAGKSTLLQIVAGVLSPTTGSVHRPAKAATMLELGSIFHPDLTGAENLELGLALAGLTTDIGHHRADEIVEFSGLEDAIDQPVKHYSDGMKARLACSIAVHTEPELLIVDEVLAVGDASFQRAVLTRIDELVDAGATLLLVTHSVDLARLTRRAIWLEEGRVVRDGPSEEVLDEYEVTSSAGRRYASTPAAHLESIDVVPDHVPPGSGFTVRSTLRWVRTDLELAARVDVRPVVGDEPWMRSVDELPEHRDLNLVATSPPVAIGTAPADGGRVEVELVVDALPVTPTELEVTLVLTGPRGEIHDELAAPLTVEGPPARPKYRMRVTPV